MREPTSLSGVGSIAFETVTWTRDVSHAPDHPALPARVSLLTFPARGMVARLLEPRDGSAVIGSQGTCWKARLLRPVR